MRLNPGLHVVHAGGGILQIGTGGRALLLQDCDDRMADLMERLTVGVPDGHELSAALDCGLALGAAQPLLGLLRRVLVPLGPSAGSFVGHAQDLLADDQAAAWARSRGVSERTESAERPSPELLVQRRGEATVQVIGLGRTGAALAQVLASAGIGQLLLHDPQPVTVADLGTAYRSADLGRVRSVALSRRLDPEERGLLAWPTATSGPVELQGDLTVAVSRGAVDRGLIAEARASDHPVLTVVARDDDLLVGPWALPGSAGCPECWELDAAGRDLPGVDRYEALARDRAGWEETSMAAAAGALAAAQVLARVDEPGAEPGQVGTMHRFTGDGHVQSRPVSPHEDCACAWNTALLAHSSAHPS